MPPHDKPLNPAREQTDESLRVERSKADEAVSDKLEALAATADAVIEKARARADAVIEAERAKVDRTGDNHGERPSAAVAEQREREDEVVDEERAVADAVVRRERRIQAATFASERTETDKDLLHERLRSDDALGKRDDFLGIVSHDLRGLLHAVIGFAAQIADAESGATPHRSEDVLGMAQRIQRAGTRMNRLVGDLVDVASIEAGMLAVTRRPEDAALVVAEAVETFQGQAVAGGLTVTSEIGAGSMSGTFDGARLLQVLANLLGNAIKFTGPGGKVVVRLERTEETLSFTVEDTGIGIDPAHVEAVFDRFRRIEPVDTRGVGLGLFISKCIVEAHAGRIWVESRVGHGSTFRFTIPLPPAA